MPGGVGPDFSLEHSSLSASLPVCPASPVRRGLATTGAPSTAHHLASPRQPAVTAGARPMPGRSTWPTRSRPAASALATNVRSGLGESMASLARTQESRSLVSVRGTTRTQSRGARADQTLQRFVVTALAISQRSAPAGRGGPPPGGPTRETASKSKLVEPRSECDEVSAGSYPLRCYVMASPRIASMSRIRIRRRPVSTQPSFLRRCNAITTASREAPIQSANSCWVSDEWISIVPSAPVSCRSASSTRRPQRRAKASPMPASSRRPVDCRNRLVTNRSTARLTLARCVSSSSNRPAGMTIASRGPTAVAVADRGSRSMAPSSPTSSPASRISMSSSLPSVESRLSFK